MGEERVEGGELPGITEFTGDARGEHEADTENAGEKGVGIGAQGECAFVAKFQGVAHEAAIKLGGGEGALQGGSAGGRASRASAAFTLNRSYEGELPFGRDRCSLRRQCYNLKRSKFLAPSLSGRIEFSMET